MSYFSKFPIFLVRVGPEQKTIQDFFLRTISTIARARLNDYIVADGERPEDVSQKLYGSPFYHWVVLLANSIVDPRLEWPKREQDMNAFILKRYGALTGVHHYRTVDGHHEITGYSNLIDSDLIEPVTFYEYETEVNEAKRRIKVLDPQFLTDFVSQFDRLIDS